MTDQRLAETPPAALVQFLVPTLSPAMGRFNLPVERLGQLAKMLFDVVPIHDLESLRKDFFADLPDPGIPVVDHHLTKGLRETPTFPRCEQDLANPIAPASPRAGPSPRVAGSPQPCFPFGFCQLFDPLAHL